METVKDERALRRAYARCRRMQLRHDPTFFAATQRLPRDVRPAVHAVYGYVRAADELVDGPARNGDRRAALDAWEHELDAARDGAPSRHPVIAALVDAGERHDLPLEELRVYMRSMRIDCDGRVRIASGAELDAYMDGSAAAVGRVMAPLLGSPDAEEVARLGVAFQLTNFIRDVREDWAMDRVYLPGLAEDELARGEAGSEVRRAVAHQVDRARALFADTAGAPDRCHADVRRGMRLARAVYARILDRVEAGGYDVVARRTSLAPWELAAAMRRA
jgi:15-cis-phytoene synthase